jgi:hypothetical protein
MSDTQPTEPIVSYVQIKTSKWTDAYNFVAKHKASFFIAGAWMVRELNTAHGLIGVWHFILTGSTN